MDQKPQLSVLLSFKNQRDEVEPTLSALFELKALPFELIIIDDASRDGTAQAIHSLVDYYQHDHTFFFEHDKPAGRGNCLNEALQQVSSPIVWAPRTLQSIDEEKLRNSIRSLKNGNAPCLLQNVTLPGSLTKWGECIRDDKLPAGDRMLWNLGLVPSSERFINPFLSRQHGTDWLLRLNMDAMDVGELFFTPSESPYQESLSASDRQELLMSLMRRPGTSAKDREKLSGIMMELPAISESTVNTHQENDLLERALKLKLDGQITEALEIVERFLQNEPDNPQAKQLKIKLLERKHRFVEASELKHELQAGAAEGVKPARNQPSPKGGLKKTHGSVNSGIIETSIIIPTALYGKSALEHCLISVEKHCNPDTAELIIIDNASLDDTHAYLEELEAKNFFHCRIITNKKNHGFAASVNQGLEAANGVYACIMHNDVEFKMQVIDRMERLMDTHSDYALMGPLADSTLNPDQLVSNRGSYREDVVQTDYLDSFCLMLRTDAGIRMDEEYTLAFFDDIDLCFEARKKGFKVGIASDVKVTHHYGTTTFALDLDTESDLYWKNIAYFNEKWGIETYSEEELRSQGRFQQLLTLNEWVNPLYPEPVIKEKFNELFTDEVKTEILKSKHEPDMLLRLVHLMMVMEKRDIMRRLEDQMEDTGLPALLIYEIVRFYFNRNVYSRCVHYLDKLTAQQESLQSDLYRLAIRIDEKKIEDAIPLLTELLDRAPSNPLLYKLAGDIHAFENNLEEADSFYSLAHQINPFEFTETQKEIKLNS